MAQRARQRRLGVFGAYARGLKLAGGTFFFVIPWLLIYAFVSGSGSYLSGKLYGVLVPPELGLATADEIDAHLEWLSTLGGGLIFLVGALCLYTIFQLFRRQRASRASWLPSLFLLPLALLSGLVYGIQSGAYAGLELFFLTLPWQAWNIVLQCVAGSWLAIIVFRLGIQVHEGRPMALGDVLKESVLRLADVAGAHGAKVHAVIVGMQVLIPGIFYALQLAFVDMIAILEPDRPALRRSGELTYGIRGRLFRMFVLWVLVSTVLQIGAGAMMEDAEVLMASLLDIRELGYWTLVVQDTIWTLTTWVLSLSLLALYLERAERIAAVEKARAAAKSG